MSEAKKIAEFTLVHLGSAGSRDPNYETLVVIVEQEGRLWAGRRGSEVSLMPLGRFYNRTPEGMYLARCIHGRYKYQDLDRAVIKKQGQRGTCRGMSGHSTWTKIWFGDGRTAEFRV